MNTRYIDAHSHLQFEQFAHDEEKILEEMQKNGIAAIVVGIDFASSRKALVLAEKYKNLYAAIGLHPNHATEGYDISYYRALAMHPKVVAVGECGLDFFRPLEVNEEVEEKQKELFKQQVAFAAEFNKPLIIHCRPSKGTMDAYQDLIQILTEAKEEHPNLRGDVHFFVGGLKEADALIRLGFTLSFTAVITFARDYDEVIKAIPLANILAETDAPYVAPAARRGERNDPIAVIDVARTIADIRGEDPETVRQTLLANAQKLFSLLAP